MRNENQNPGTLPPGLYYVGDLCYLPEVVIGDWSEFCNHFYPDDKPEQSGVFTDKNGNKFANFNTFYGDGLFKDLDESSKSLLGESRLFTKVFRSFDSLKSDRLLSKADFCTVSASAR